MSIKSLAAILGRPVSLAQDPDRFRLVDVLTAVAGAMARFTIDRFSFREYIKGSRDLHLSYLVSLGTDAIAFKYGKRQPSGPAAVRTLALMLSRKHAALGAKKLERVAQLVIGEWNNESCQTCRGTGWIFNFEGVKKWCTACDTAGQPSGRRRYTDAERAEVLEIPLHRLRDYAAPISQAESFLAMSQAAAMDAAKRAHGL